LFSRVREKSAGVFNLKVKIVRKRVNFLSRGLIS
jgi:hypothetical protein